MRRRLLSPWVLGLLMCAFSLPPGPAPAQLVEAYTKGYKPARELNDKLKELINSAEKREDYAAVKELGARYVEYLSAAQTALENAGSLAKGEDTVQGKIKAALSGCASLAQNAKTKAERLRDKGDQKQNCLGEALNLQKDLDEFGKALEKGWKEHEDYGRQLEDNFNVSEAKYEDVIKSISKDVLDLEKRVGEAAAKAKEERSKSLALNRITGESREQLEKLRAMVASKDITMSVDDIQSKSDTMKKLGELATRTIDAQIAQERVAQDAEKALADAENALNKALEQYKKDNENVESIFFSVLNHRRKLAAFRAEYKSFSF